MKYRGKTFENKTLRLDGNQYSDCTFVNCLLEIGAQSPFEIDESCVMDECRVTLVGAAKNLVQMLTQLYRMPHHRPAIDGLIDGIRTGTVKQIPYAKDEPREGFDA